MTPEMIDKARANARKGNYRNVEFRLGEIENLPVADNTADIVISNCVINLSPNKKRVFEEAFRTLKPGGRLVVSDMVLLKELSEDVKKMDKNHTSCVSRAMMKDKYLETMRQVGFQEVKIVEETRFSKEDVTTDPSVEAAMKNPEMAKQIEEILNSTASVKVSAIKPPN
jgi:ubiquinone/menaquinone biosynthesis C-methylase UbiE